MESFPKLNFPAINLRGTEENGRKIFFDKIRSMYVVLTPEEWVRQHLVGFLIDYCKTPLRSLIEEYPVEINSMSQRADVVVVDSAGAPHILVECKAPDINLTNRDTLKKVFEQATRYNAVIGAQYIIITNGLSHFCYLRTEEGYQPQSQFPILKEE